MEYRRKYVSLKENENKNNKTDTIIITIEKEEKPKNDNSYLQKLLQNSDKTIKSGSINLTSYKENLPNFKTSIRDILSTEENKQKAINYVIQKRNEEKYGKKTNVINSQDKNKNNLYSNNNNYFYNSNSKIYNKNDSGFKTNRSNINSNKTINIENNLKISRPKYSYYIEKRNKPFIPSKANENNLGENNDNRRANNSIRNNYINKSSNKAKENNINNYIGKHYIIKTNNNNNHIYNINIPSPNNRNNIDNSNDKNYKKVKKYQIIRSNKTKGENPSPSFRTNKIPLENANINNTKYRQIGNYMNKNDTNKILNNKTERNNKNTSTKKSYDLLPNFKANVSIYYSSYSKKKDNLNKSKESENKIREFDNKINQKIMFRDYKNFKISKNNLQLNTKKDNKFRYKKENKNKKSKNIKEKAIEININGSNENINNGMTNLK